MTANKPNVNRFTVTDDQAERRLDRLLRTAYKSVPLGAIMKAIRTGAVKVNGRKKDAAHRLEPGDVVTVPWLDGAATAAEPAPTKRSESLEVVYQDDSVICVNKPAGLLSQPDGKGGDSVITRIWEMLAWQRTDFRPALIGRLDRNVSGLCLAAMTANSLRTLSSLIAAKAVEKKYLAIVTGKPPAEGIADFPLRKDAGRNIALCDHEDGKEAVTLYRTRETKGGCSLMELTLVTGRQHQARAHMSLLGHPILGDVKYGGAASPEGLVKRLYLHCLSLGFPDSPEITNNLRGKTIKTKFPAEFASLFP